MFPAAESLGLVADVFDADDHQQDEKGRRGTVTRQDVRFPLLDGLLASLGELAEVPT